MPPRTRPLPASHILLALVTLAVLVVTALPAALTFGSARAAESVGATGNDPRPFPKTFHLWGGNPSNYSKYDVVIGYPDWNVSSLRSSNPSAIYLLNAMLDPWNSDWRQRKGLAVTYGGQNTFTGATDTIVDGSAANLGSIPGWNTYWDTLHHPDGTVATVNSSYGHPGWNLTRTDTAEKVAEIEAYGAKLSKLYGNGWDGMWSDNWIYRIGASWFYGTDLDTNRDGQRDDLGVVKGQWWNGLNLVGQRLRSYLPGKIVGGNGAHNIEGITGGSDPDGPYKASNVTMNEVLELYTTRPDTIVSEVQTYLGFPDPHGMSRYFLLMHKLPGGQADYKSMRWGFSLATIAGAYYEPYAVDHNDAFSYDEFTGGSTIGKRGWLGRPVSAPTKLSSGVWRRDFEYGVVLNNSTSSAQTVSLGATYQRLKGAQVPTVNSGTSVTSVTLPAGDGLFLSGSSGSAPTLTAPENTSPPVVSGTPMVGEKLTATTGGWSGSPTSYAYQWQRCDASGGACLDVSGATTSTYVVQSADVGSTMRVEVTAKNSAGSGVAVSKVTGVVLAAFSVTQNIVDGSTVSGTVTWAASPSGKTVSKVDFSVDGKVVATDTSAPFSTSLDTTSLVDGQHVFGVKATATDGDVATASANANVGNGSGSLQVSHNLTDGQTVSGPVDWSATASGKAVSRVEFRVDGVLVGSDTTSPYGTTVDSKGLDDGVRQFAAKAVATDGTSASAIASVIVSNDGSQAFSVSQNLVTGQVLSGAVTWAARPSVSEVRKVEFLVDGAKVATEPNAPYELSFDTLRLADGTHGFGVKAYAADGATAQSHVLVTVANKVPVPPPAPSEPPATFTIGQSVQTGQTLSGQVAWTASPAGKTVDRVEFVVDGRVAWTERYTPYVYNGDGATLDTRTLSNGSHTLAVKAYATDGTTASASASVQVSNTASELTLVSSIKDESTITGQVSWTITPSGKTVSRIEFFIDTRLMWTERYAPWVYGGDDRKLDTSTLSRGLHTFAVKAYATDGTVTVLTLRVTVA